MPKIYPFEGDENYLYVCWSVAQQMKRADRDTITHICHHSATKTLCGLSTLSGPYPWEYEIWDINWDGKHYGDIKSVSDIGCIHCKRSTHLTNRS